MICITQCNLKTSHTTWKTKPFTKKLKNAQTDKKIPNMEILIVNQGNKKTVRSKSDASAKNQIIVVGRRNGKIIWNKWVTANKPH